MDKTEKKATFDGLLEDLGSPSRYQVLLFILLCCNVFPVSLNYMAMSFYGANTKYSCKLPNDWKWDRNVSIPKSDGKYESCLMYKNPDNTSLGTTPCLYGYEYHLEDYEWTISSEWDLTCDVAYLSKLAQTIFMAGVMVGSLIFGVLGDKFGRRPVILVTLYSQAILGVASYFSPNYTIFVIVKFFQGALLQGLQNSNNSFVMELFETRYRTIAGMIIAMLATSCSMVIALIAYLIQKWYYIQLAISLPTVLALVQIWVVPESLRWLMSKNRIEPAVNLIKKYTKVEKQTGDEDRDLGVRVKDVAENMVSSTAQQGVQSDIIQLMRTAGVRRNAIVLFYCWFVASVVYYGITFSIPNLSGNRYLNFFIGGALETAARFVGYFIISRVGRRYPLIICYILSGILCIASACLTEFVTVKTPTIQGLTTALILIGKAAMGQCFAFILIYTSEIFPTVLRTAGSGACYFWSRIGGMVAPQTVLLGDFVGKATPFIVFGALSILSGLLVFLMPETVNKPLPDTVQDAQDINDVQQPSQPDAVRVDSQKGDSLKERKDGGSVRERKPENGIAGNGDRSDQSTKL